MATLVAVFGGAIAVVGATGVASPAALMRLVNSVWRSERGVYLAVAIRLILGVVLIVAAPSCRFPGVVRIIGIVSVVAALIIPFLGFERLRAIVDWWLSRPHGFVRAWALLAMALGGFLVYAGT
jgi:hypothetical protein